MSEAVGAAGGEAPDIVRPYEAADEPAVHRVMLASLEFDRFPGIGERDIEHQVLSMRGRPD